MRSPTLLLRAAAERIRVSLWFAPALAVVAAYGSATALAGVQVTDGSWFFGLVFGGDAESARQLMATIAGSMITLTGVVFTLTVVALQIASGQYSPRVLRNFLRDRANQTVLAGFLATFVWAVAVLPSIRVAQEGQPEEVPRLAVTVGTLLVGASLGLLVFFIHRLTTSIRVESIMRTAREETLETIRRVHPQLRKDAPARPAVPEIPQGAASVPFRRSGYIQAVDQRRLVRFAARHDAVIMLEQEIGTHVVERTLGARVWCRSARRDVPHDLTARIDQGIQIGFERTMQEDVGFGVRQLTDIAVKALSPGVNDPTTAVDAVGHLSVIMATLAQHSLDGRLYDDAEGIVRVSVPGPTFDAYLTMCVSQIRRYGASEPAVLAALLQLLLDVATTSSDGEVDRALQRQAEMLMDAAANEVALKADLEALVDLRSDLADALGADAEGRPLAP